MIDLILPVLSGAIGAGTGAVGAYVIAKKMFNNGKILELVDVLTTEVMTNTELQKRIYSIGTLLGQGIAQGTGLKSSGGKLKFQDIIMQGASMFLQNFGKTQGQTTTATETGVNVPDLF